MIFLMHNMVEADQIARDIGIGGYEAAPQGLKLTTVIIRPTSATP